MGRLLLGVTIAVALGRPVPPEPHRFEAVEPHMGTLVRVTLYTPDEHIARKAFRAAFDRIHALDRILSDYRPDSELNEITRAAVGRPVPVSEDLFSVLRASQELAELTDGAFDITQGPLVRLWRDARALARPPDPSALAEASSRSGFGKLRLDAARRTVTLSTPGMALDVGGIGKGYAASEALAVLTGLGVGSALVAVSGDLACGDAPPGRAGWRIRLPVDGMAGVPEVLELTHSAVSTSGGSLQHLEVDRRRFSHIIEPRSGLGLTDDLTVTVVARDGMTADALATAVSVLGTDRGLALVETRPDAAVLAVQRSGAEIAVRRSSRFRSLITR